MNKTFLVFQNEFLTTVKRRSFIITLFLIPLVGFVVVWFTGGFGENIQSQQITDMLIPSTEKTFFGVVDLNNLIEEIPDGYSDSLILYQNEDEAIAALEENLVSAYYVIQPDYVNQGKISFVQQEFNPLTDSNASYMIEDLLSRALLKDHPEIIPRVLNLYNLNYEILSPEPERDPNSELTFFLPYIVTMLFYMVIMSSASLMLNSISNEKTNRVMEILMTSIKPNQMLLGKIMALGLVGLLQTVIWSGAGYLLLRISGRSINLAAGYQLPPSILFWGILFFLSGYALYASLMAGVGAMVPNLKESSQATTILILPMIIPLILLSPIIENSNGPLAMTLSFVPFTAPITMMTRLSAGTVPIWQLITSLVLIFVTAYLVIRSVAGLFRANYLLSGEPFKTKRFILALFGKV